MATQNYMYVKKWRENNPELHRMRNLLYATKAQKWKTIRNNFIKYDKFDPCLFL
jgi:hypothetical protein